MSKKEDKILYYGVIPKILALIVSISVNIFFIITWINNPSPTLRQLVSAIFIDLIPISYLIWLFGSKIKYSSEYVVKLFFSYERNFMRWDQIKDIIVILNSKSFVLYDNDGQEMKIGIGQNGITQFVEDMENFLPISKRESLENQLEDIKQMMKLK